MLCRGACAKRVMLPFPAFTTANAAATIHFAVARIFRARSKTISDVTWFMQA